jgi:NAD(P)-dependent dehydrogenase (short-subunit alcohol dehydrogenase family)
MPDLVAHTSLEDERTCGLANREPSVAALRGNAGSAASKHGVLGLTRPVAKEVGPLGTRVNAASRDELEHASTRRHGRARPEARRRVTNSAETIGGASDRFGGADSSMAGSSNRHD